MNELIKIIMKNSNKKRVVFYLNENDKILLNNQCEILKIKASFFVRNSVLEKLGKPVLEVKQNNLETKNYTFQLLKIGNNLNQIAKKLNSDEKFLLADQQVVLSDIEILKEHIVLINSKLI